jgi:hypothetical protein
LGKDDKLTLLLMRDVGHVRQYQFRRMWFNLFLYAQAGLFLAAASGLYGCFFHWSRHMELINIHAALREQASEQQMHIARLQHVLEILTTGEHELKILFSTHYSTHSSGPGSREIDLSTLFAHVDLQVVSVSNLQVRTVGDKLRLSFELHNHAGGSISGMTSVYLVRRNASVFQAQADKDELSFAIERNREVNSMLELPSGIALDDIFALRLVISNTEHEDMFIQTYILSDIMAMM